MPKIQLIFTWVFTYVQRLSNFILAFLYLEPQFAGATFHKVSLNADAGEIPSMRSNDGITILSKVVVKAANDLIKLLKIERKKWIYKKQKKQKTLP